MAAVSARVRVEDRPIPVHRSRLVSARSVFAGAAICAIWATQSSPAPAQQPASAAAREGHVSVGAVSLYVRDVGRGEPVLVLHGGPDFDHRYLLPELDRL